MVGGTLEKDSFHPERSRWTCLIRAEGIAAPACPPLSVDFFRPAPFAGLFFRVFPSLFAFSSLKVNCGSSFSLFVRQ